MQKLEGHVEEHSSYEVCITELNAALDNITNGLLSLSETSLDQPAVEDKLQKLQVFINVLDITNI